MEIGNRQREQTTVFISYAREDRDFVRDLITNLNTRGIEAKGDWLLTTGEDYARSLREFNLGAHAFLFVISPDSIRSEACRNELSLAVEHKKQILPISLREHQDDNLLDSALRAPQWTFFREGDDVQAAMGGLVKAINTDFALMDMHGRLLVAADNWDNNRRNRSYLLRKDGLRNAEAWLALTSAQPAKLPQPTPLEVEYIFASQRSRSRGLRISLGVALSVAISLILLSIVAVAQRTKAQQQATIAQQNEGEAKRQKKQAEENATEAKRQQTEAEKQKRQAEDNASEAQKQRNQAVSARLAEQKQRREADTQRGLAVQGRKEAEHQTGIAMSRLASIYWNSGIKAREQGQLIQAAHQFMRAAEGFAQVNDLVSSRNAQLAAEYLVGDYELQDIIEMNGIIGGALLDENETNLALWTTRESPQSWVGMWDQHSGGFRVPPINVSEDLIGCRLNPELMLLCWGRVHAWTGGTIHLWSGITGRAVFAPIIYENESMGDPLFSHDGEHLLIRVSDETNPVLGKAFVVDARTGTPITPPLMHGAFVQGGLFTRDDSHVLTWSKGEAKLWNSRSGALLATMNVQAEDINGALFSPDETRIVTWGRRLDRSGGIARLWNGQTGAALSPPLSHDEEVKGACFNADGSMLLTWSGEFSGDPGNGSARVWDGSTGKPLTAHLKHNGDVRGAQFSSNGKQIMTWSKDRMVRVWNLSSSGASQAFSHPLLHDTNILDAHYTQEGASIVSATVDGAIHLWDAHTGNLVSEDILNQQSIRGQLVTRDQRTVVTWKDEGAARIWRRRPEREFVVSLRHPGLRGSRLNDDGTRLVTWDYEGVVRVWNALTGSEIAIRKQPKLDQPWDIRDVVFGPDNRHALILVGSHYNGVYGGFGDVLDLETGERVNARLTHADRIEGAAFSPDASSILTWSDDKTARLWSSSTGLPITAPMPHQFQVRAATFGSEAKIILTYDGSIRAWDPKTGQPLPVPVDLKWRVKSGTYAQWAIRGTHSVEWGEEITLANDAVTHRVIKQGPIGIWGQAVFSADGSRLLVITEQGDRGAEVWDSDTGKVLSRFTGHTLRIQGGVFTADGRKVLTWSNDHTARLWDSQTGKELIPPLQHSDTVWTAVLTRDESRILTVGGKGLRIWNALTGEPLSTWLKSMGSDPRFTPDESRILALNFRNAELRDGRSGQLILPTLRLRWPNDDPYADYGGQVASSDGFRIVDWNSVGRIRIWNFRPDYAWPRDQLRLRLEVLTGTRLNTLDEIEILSRKEWQEEKSRYEEIQRQIKLGG